jgi:phosphatidylglycerophosphatase A
MSDAEINSKDIPFIHKFFATGFYSGFSPIVPGTAGSLVGLLIYLIPGVENIYVLGPLSILFFFIGIFTSSRLEKQLGEDPSIVVIDEIVGMWISLFFLPKNPAIYIGAFVLFRVFDIVKPSPARQVERYKGGWGIMLDDVFAGIYANIVMQIILLIF